MTNDKHRNKKLSLYTKFLFCMINKDEYEPFKKLAKEVGSTEASVIKHLYRIDRGSRSAMAMKIIDAIKKLCPKSGLVKHIKNRS